MVLSACYNSKHGVPNRKNGNKITVNHSRNTIDTAFYGFWSGYDSALLGLLRHTMPRGVLCIASHCFLTNLYELTWIKFISHAIFIARISIVKHFIVL